MTDSDTGTRLATLEAYVDVLNARLARQGKEIESLCRRIERLTEEVHQVRLLASAAAGADVPSGPDDALGTWVNASASSSEVLISATDGCITNEPFAFRKPDDCLDDDEYHDGYTSSDYPAIATIEDKVIEGWQRR